MTIRDSFEPEPPDERVERLLTDAAGWEPDEPAPVGFAYSALARMEQAQEQEQEQEPRQRRRAAGRVALWAGLFLGTGACCASLVMALTTTRPPSQEAAHLAPTVQPPVPTVTPPQTEPVRTVEDVSPRFVVPPVNPRRSPVRLSSAAPARRRSGASHFRREEPAPLLRAQWVDHRVSEEVDGVMASGWVAEPLSGGDVRISPIVIDVPTRSQASPEVPASHGQPISPASSPGIEGVNR